MKRTHPLAAYLEKSGESVAEVAARAGVSRMSLYRIIRGDQVPSLDMIGRLKRATGGSVSAEDFMPLASSEHETTSGATEAAA